MDQEFLGDRRKALEKSFFVKENERLRAALNEKRAAEERKAALADVSGITDDAVLSHLDALDIGCDTLTALSLIPVVAVADASGGIIGWGSKISTAEKSVPEELERALS